MTKLCETENIPFDEKIIYEKWELRFMRIDEASGKIESGTFYWFIAEYDEKKELAFGYANLTVVPKVKHIEELFDAQSINRCM